MDLSAPFAVAVSGGADSMCLAFLARDMKATALVVDHRLRPESNAEADATIERLQSFGMKTELLVWKHENLPASNIQAAAREARYWLMSEWCAAHGIKTLLTAHHKDDLAETFLLRLARGSGLYGLAAMSGARQLGQGVKLVRPFLGVEKQQLVEALQANDIEWVEDRSNQNTAFDRVKARQFLSSPPLHGLNSERLVATAQSLARARDAIDFYVAKWLEDAVEFFEEGCAILSPGKLAEVPEEVSLKGLSQVMRFASGSAYPPRLEKITRIWQALQAADFAGATLSGAQFVPHSSNQILIVRERVAVTEPQAVRHGLIWDGRYVVTRNSIESNNGWTIQCLGENGLRTVQEDEGPLSTLPRAALMSLPAIFDGDSLIAVPHLGYGDDINKQLVLTHRWLTSSKTGEKRYRAVQ